MSTDKTNEPDDFDFAEAMAPEYTPRPRVKGYRQRHAFTGRADLANNGAIGESDAAAADRENGRAW